MQPHPGFISLIEKILCQVHHTFQPVQGNPWQCAEPNNCLELWEEHLKDPLAALAKALECLEKPHSLSFPAFVVAMACSIAGAGILKNMWEGPNWEVFWLCLDPWDATQRAFLLPHQEGAGVSAEALKACALVGSRR